jgi:hypothetical protein
MRIHLLTGGMLMGVCMLGLNGCGKGPAGGEAGGLDHGHGHVHAEIGPHGGEIVEIDAKNHHAEVVHDDATHKIGVYLLDGEGIKDAPIDAKSVMINVSEDGTASQYELPAVPQSGDAEGSSSYFEIVSEPLCGILCGESEAKLVQARLSLKMGEKPYVGFLKTSGHDHEHGHEHSDAHGHSHAAGESLKWEQELEQQGYQIALGFHGEKLLAGQDIEPAVKITRDGEPVADAKVFNALLADDGQKVLVAEVPTVYEPPTDDEPAHYAQGALRVPSDVQKVVLRFRINIDAVDLDFGIGRSARRGRRCVGVGLVLGRAGGGNCQRDVRRQPDVRGVPPA